MAKEVFDNYYWIVTTSRNGNVLDNDKKLFNGITLVINDPYEKSFRGTEESDSVKFSDSYKETNFIRYRASKDPNLLNFLNKIKDIAHDIPDVFHIKNIELYELGKINDAKGYVKQTKDVLAGIINYNLNREYLLVELLGSYEAINFYDRILEDDAYNLNAITHKAFLLHAVGANEDAIMCFDEDRYLGDESHNFYINKAGLLTIIGNFQQAIEAYDKVLTLFPERADQHSIISCKAYALHQLGKFDYAGKCFEIVENGFSITDTYFYYCKANFLRDINNKEEAVKYYQIAEKSGLVSIELYENIANVLRSLGRQEEVLEYFNKILEIKPDDSQALEDKVHISELIETKKESQQLIILEKANFYQYMGNLYEHLVSDGQKALEFYNKAENLGLNTSELYRKKVELLKRLNELQKAMEYCNKILNIKPDDPTALQEKLRISELIETEKESNQYLISEIRKRAYSYQQAGDVAEALGNKKEALKCYNKAENLGLNVDLNMSELYINKASILQSIHELERSLEYCNKVLEIKPDDPEAIKLKSMIWQQMTQIILVRQTGVAERFIINAPNIDGENKQNKFNFNIIDNYYKLDYDDTSAIDAELLDGITLIHNKNFKQASEYFKELVELGYSNSYALFQFVQCKLLQERGAIRFLNQVEGHLRYNKEFQYIKGAELYLIGISKEAIKYFDLAEQGGINSNAFYLDKAYVLLDLERLDEALELYDKILANDPYECTAIYFKACLLYLFHRYKEAYECFDEGQYLSDNLIHFYYNKALFLTVTENFQTAILYYNKALNNIVGLNSVDRLDVMICKAYSIHKLGNCEEASQYFDVVEQYAKKENINIDDVYFYYCKGNLLQDCGKKQEAFKY